MELEQSLTSLENRVCAALRHLPGAADLYLFGSSANPASRDAYSDLDMQVVTGDFILSKASFLPTLEKAGRIDVAYLLVDRPNELAYSIAFTGESLFHKVDIGVSAPAGPSQPATFVEKVDPKILLWSHPPLSADSSMDARPVYTPLKGSPAYFLMGELMSAVRYVKCRKRQRHLSCWRFFSAKVNALLIALWWQRYGGVIPEKLSTWDLVNIDRLLPEKDRLALLKMVDCQDPASMDRSLYEITRQLAGVLRPSLTGEDAQANRLVDHYLEFIHQMLLA